MAVAPHVITTVGFPRTSGGCASAGEVDAVLNYRRTTCRRGGQDGGADERTQGVKSVVRRRQRRGPISSRRSALARRWGPHDSSWPGGRRSRSFRWGQF